MINIEQWKAPKTHRHHHPPRHHRHRHRQNIFDQAIETVVNPPPSQKRNHPGCFHKPLQVLPIDTVLARINQKQCWRRLQEPLPTPR